MSPNPPTPFTFPQMRQWSLIVCAAAGLAGCQSVERRPDTTVYTPTQSAPIYATPDAPTQPRVTVDGTTQRVKPQPLPTTVPQPRSNVPIIVESPRVAVVPGPAPARQPGDWDGRDVVPLNNTGQPIDGRAAAATLPQTVSRLVKIDRNEGTGKIATEKSAVMVHYVGYVYDPNHPEGHGVKFDSSRDRGVGFGVFLGQGRMIKAWEEGVIGMKERGKRTIVIPARDAYGDKPVGDKVPPNSNLLFELELIRVIQ